METHLMEIILGLKVIVGLVKTMKIWFGYLCRFLTSALTPRPQNTYICVFLALLEFCNFFCHFVVVLEARSDLLLFYAKFWVTRATFLASTCFSLQKITAKLVVFFLRFQTKEQALRVNKSKITGRNPFKGNDFGIEDNHGSSKDKNILFGVFLEICDQCFNP